MAMFGGGFANVLQTLGAALKDGSPGSEGGNLAALQANQQRQALMQRQQMLGAKAAGLFGGGFANGGGGQMDPRAMAAELAQIQAQGGDIAPYAQLLPFLQPNVQVGPDGMAYDQKDPSVVGRRFRNPTAVANTVVDLNSPDNEDRVIPEAPVKGAMPVYDNRGRVTDWTLPAGAQATIGQASQADTTGRTMGTVFNNPNGDGSTTPTLGRDMFGGGGRGVGTTQTPADAIRAESAARGDAERANAVQDKATTAGQQLAATAEMKKWLPDVISGFGAEARLNAARALALTGNEKAAREVKATETFINQGRVLVANIIKTFGANPTEGERKFAEKMSGADATLNKETLAEGIALQEDRIRRDLQNAGRAAPKGGPVAIAPPAASRVRNTVYMTPRGPLTWTGTGWRQ